MIKLKIQKTSSFKQVNTKFAMPLFVLESRHALLFINLLGGTPLGRLGCLNVDSCHVDSRQVHICKKVMWNILKLVVCWSVVGLFKKDFNLHISSSIRHFPYIALTHAIAQCGQKCFLIHYYCLFVANKN